MPIQTHAILYNGDKMPLLGYGTWQAAKGELEGPLHEAIAAGYRHIDTASAYNNEDAIGKVLHEKWLGPGKLKREDLYIVTKLPASGVRVGGPRKWLKRSLEKLGLDYVDMYLIHLPMCAKEIDDSPFPRNPDGTMPFEDNTDHVAVWKDMEAEQKAGRTRAIGLSNFNKRQIQLLLDNCTIRPANLQVELHVYMQQRPLVEFCKQNNIVVTAYSPIGSPGSATFATRYTQVKLPDLIRNPVVVAVAEKHKKSPGQVLLKHIVQQGVSAIPKSFSKERIAQNIALFDWELGADDVAKLNALDQGKNGRIFDFTFLGVNGSHPAFPFDEYP